MKIHSLETGNFMLDGGAIFGVIPKSLWSKVYPADDNNLCNFSMRCLLIETNKRLLLIDTGIGRKQSDKFFSYYFLNGNSTLEKSLTEKGFSKSDITDVLLTHLHFDHCGGAVEMNEGGQTVPSFPNADYWVSQSQWDWAMSPNKREKASFLTENYNALERSNKIKFITSDTDFEEGIRIRLFNGHTEGLIVPFIKYGNTTLVYTSDMLPTAAHVPLSWICGYDTRPLISLEEKTVFLQETVENSYILYFEHDLYTECCTLKNTEKGVRVDKSFPFKACYP